MDFTTALVIGLLLVAATTVSSLAALIFYRRWRRGQRLAVLSEQSRASRVRAETTRQVIKRQRFFISRYVNFLATPAGEIDELAGKIASSPDLVTAHIKASQLQTRSRLLLQSINTLKDFAALERGELTLHLQPFSSRRLLEDAISNMRTFLSSNQQHLQLDIKSWQEHTIMVDYDKFCAMLGHLGHAIAHYLPQECNVSFTAESIRSGENRIVAWLKVSDNVTDFDLPCVEQLFDPMSFPIGTQENSDQQVHMPSLDLPFAKHLAELMGGTLNFRRAGTGHAAEIELFFNIDDSKVATERHMS